MRVFENVADLALCGNLADRKDPRRSAAFRPTQEAQFFFQRSGARRIVRVTGGAQCPLLAPTRPNHGRRRSPSHVTERPGGVVAREYSPGPAGGCGTGEDQTTSLRRRDCALPDHTVGAASCFCSAVPVAVSRPEALRRPLRWAAPPIMCPCHTHLWRPAGQQRRRNGTFASPWLVAAVGQHLDLK